MSLDISYILNDWPYDPGRLSARKVVGDDGTDKIQLRMDLGLLQMEATGHPAGVRPRGHESLLAYYQDLRDRRRRDAGSDDDFHLDGQACESLRNEAVMYYHRYLAEFVLEDYRAVIRDTMRNLKLMDFCTAYADDESDKLAIEQYRPYVVMMRTRASGLLAMRDNHPKTALAAIRKGIAEITDFYEGFGDDRLIEASGELPILKALAKEIEQRMGRDPVMELKKNLDLAIKEERYEEAAGLRDRLRHLTGNAGSGKKA